MQKNDLVKSKFLKDKDYIYIEDLINQYEKDVFLINFRKFSDKSKKKMNLFNLRRSIARLYTELSLRKKMS